MIDLSLLAPPAIIDALGFETILAELKADAIARLPDLADLLELESEPVTALLQVIAYRELLLRQRINEASKAVMLAYAAGADLDQIGTNYGIPRLVLTPGDPEAIPPVDDVMEADTDFRTRIVVAAVSARRHPIPQPLPAAPHLRQCSADGRWHAPGRQPLVRRPAARPRRRHDGLPDLRIVHQHGLPASTPATRAGGLTLRRGRAGRRWPNPNPYLEHSIQHARQGRCRRSPMQQRPAGGARLGPSSRVNCTCESRVKRQAAEAYSVRFTPAPACGLS